MKESCRKSPTEIKDWATQQHPAMCLWPSPSSLAFSLEDLTAYSFLTGCWEEISRWLLLSNHRQFSQLSWNQKERNLAWAGFGQLRHPCFPQVQNVAKEMRRAPAFQKVVMLSIEKVKSAGLPGKSAPPGGRDRPLSRVYASVLNVHHSVCQIPYVVLKLYCLKLSS